MRHLKNTVINRGCLVAAALSLLLFAACGGGGKDGNTPPPQPKPQPPPPVTSISISPPVKGVMEGKSFTFQVARQNTDDFTLSVVPAAGSGCVKSGVNAVTCTPSLSGIYDITVTASSDATKTSKAQMTAWEESISYPGAVETMLYGINNHGRFIGEFIDGNGRRRAFLGDGGGYTLIVPPGSAGDVYVYDINDSGQILGYHGTRYFLRTGTRYQWLENHPARDYTDYTGINNSGDLVGFFTDLDGKSGGFVRTGNVFTEINHPDAASACASLVPCGTWITGINNLGRMTGVYRGSNGFYRGFVYDGGVYTPVDHPGSRINIEISGINDLGQLSGFSWGEDGFLRGFIMTGGRFVEITHPLAAGNGEGTYVSGINNSGRIAGWFDDGGSARGFLLNTE